MAKQSKDRSDWELVEAVRSGSQDAFTVLVARYQYQVANLAYLSLGNKAEAEDITQEVFFRFYQSLDSLSRRDSVFPWIYRIASNLCIDEARKRKIRKLLSLDFLLDEGSSGDWLADPSLGADGIVEEEEERSGIMRALGSLSASERTVVVMRDYEGLSYEEISEVLGITISNVKTRLYRARRHLAGILRPERNHS